MDIADLLTETQTWDLTNFFELEDIDLYRNKVTIMGYDAHSALEFLYGQVINNFKLGINPEMILNYVPLFHNYMLETID